MQPIGWVRNTSRERLWTATCPKQRSISRNSLRLETNTPNTLWANCIWTDKIVNRLTIVSQSAAQRNEYAQFFLDRWDNLKPSSGMLSVTRLLHHMSRIFQDQAPAPSVPGGVRIDRKRLQQLREKKIAMGHKPDDHEETQTGMTMGGM